MITKRFRVTSLGVGLALSLFLQGESVAQVDEPSRVIGTIVVNAHKGDIGKTSGAIKTISAKAAAFPSPNSIELPDVVVSLKSVATGSIVSKGKTGLDGKFDLKAPSHGDYQVCWKVANNTACSKTVKSEGVDISTGLIFVPIAAPVIFGKVLTADNRPCWVNDNYFNLDVATFVSAENANKVLIGQTVRANVQGEYVLMGLPIGKYLVSARCEKSTISTKISLRGSFLQNMILPNHAPKLTQIDAKSSNGLSILRADIGEQLAVQAIATDPDQDGIEYLWKTTENNGFISTSNNVANQNWSLPKEGGLQSTYLIARDNKGGYAYRRFDISAGNNNLTFSGTVIDETTQRPIPDAIVTLGNESIKTNAQGWFSLVTRPQKLNRYVLNIKHPSYALLSRIYDKEETSVSYEMIRTQVSKIPADGKLLFVDSESSGWCGSDNKGQVPTVEVKAKRRLLIGDQREQARTLKAMLSVDDNALAKKCKPRSAVIEIPAGGLVDSKGQVPAGMITSSIATLDASRRALPGDYRALGSDGQESSLLSFGSVYAEFLDDNGEKLNLAPGQTAELRIPVPAAQSAAAPKTIPLWSYDEGKGLWIEEGEAALTDTTEGRFYIGKTKHFSSINMDIKITGGTCARLHVPPGSFTGWSNLVLRSYVSYGGTSSQVNETPLNIVDEFHGIFRIPFGPTTAPNTLRLEVRGSFNGQQVVLLNDIVDIDQLPPNPTSDALSYPYPYNECGTPIELVPPAGVVPDYGLDAAGRPYFLTGPYGSFNPVGFDPTVYYTAIDPSSAKTTLGAWWSVNGFGSDGLGAGNPSYTRAAYLNHNDLGFGRDMHCLKTGTNLACYVTNYGLPNQSLGNADAAANLDVTKRGATVTMEYDSANPDTNRRVQFYVYGGGVANSPRINYADLDGFGPKPVPQLCTVCHGGNFDASISKVTGAHFREFDLPSFKYSSGHIWDYGQVVSSTTPTAAEFGAFANLNKMVHDINPPSKIGALITAWYPGGFTANPLPILPTPPSGWSSNAALYHGAYGQACRTCHIARDPGLDFNTPAQFGGTSFVVCGSGRVMPNAIVTYKNFWGKTPLVLQYEAAQNPPIPATTCQNN